MKRTWPVLAVALLAGCGTFDNNDVAADVDGTEISRDDYEQLLAGLIADEQNPLPTDPSTETVDGPSGREVLRILIVTEAIAGYAAANGEPVTDDDVEAARQSVEAGRRPPAVVEAQVAREAALAAARRVAPDDDLQARYESSPSELGVMCVRHILVASAEEAEAIVEELEGGADFSELAAERSSDQATAQNGGALELQPGQPCAPLEQAEAALDPVFVDAATDAVPGTPTDPVETSFGYHVILARPYDEVADAVAAAVGDARLVEHLNSVPVTVDPRYGRWDGETLTVIEL